MFYGIYIQGSFSKLNGVISKQGKLKGYHITTFINLRFVVISIIQNY